MRMLKAIYHRLTQAEEAIGALAFTVMFSSVAIQVFARYVLRSPLVWPFELSIFAYIYVVYVGAGVAARRRSHVRFQILSDRMAGRTRILCGISTDLMFIALVAWTMPAAVDYMGFVGSVRSSALGIPWYAVLGVYPAGMALICLHLVINMAGGVRELFSGDVR